MKTRIRKLFVALAILAMLTLNSRLSTASGQGTAAFTYQGQLRDNGTNANGTYTMVFNLYDSPNGGNLIDGPITTSATLANGLFTVNLNFGAGAFNGSTRYLDITVQSGSDSEELSPRVQVLPSPYALYAGIAATVTNGAIMNAQLAAGAVTTTNIQNAAITTAQIANNTITSAQLATNSVYANNIAPGQVVKGLVAGDNSVIFPLGNDVGMISALVPNVQLFFNVTDSTFIVPSNVTRILVVMWGGGGGGGGGCNDTANNIYTSGGGGGAGCYAFNIFNVTPGSTYLVTAGAGGTSGNYGVPGQNGSQGSASSFGTLMTADGGGGGYGGIDTQGHAGAGGSGASCTGAIAGFHSRDGQGGNGVGNGGAGASAWGGGIGGWGGGTAGSAEDGEGPGAGGGGGGQGNSPGGNGSGGAVFVYY